MSRFAGQYEHVFETATAGVTIQAPQVVHVHVVLCTCSNYKILRSCKDSAIYSLLCVCLCLWQLDINTVAAGGGSMLIFRAGLFVVGPESAGAHPGPVCYKKGTVGVWVRYTVYKC